MKAAQILLLAGELAIPLELATFEFKIIPTVAINLDLNVLLIYI